MTEDQMFMLTIVGIAIFFMMWVTVHYGITKAIYLVFGLDQDLPPPLLIRLIILILSFGLTAIGVTILALSLSWSFHAS